MFRVPFLSINPEPVNACGKTTMKILFATVFFIIVLNYTIIADETNDNRNADSNRQWEMLIKKYPKDLEIVAWNALRVKLLQKVESGDIAVKKVSDMFDNIRLQLIDKKSKEPSNAQKKNKSEPQQLRYLAYI